MSLLPTTQAGRIPACACFVMADGRSCTVCVHVVVVVRPVSFGRWCDGPLLQAQTSLLDKTDPTMVVRPSLWGCVVWGLGVWGGGAGKY